MVRATRRMRWYPRPVSRSPSISPTEQGAGGGGERGELVEQRAVQARVEPAGALDRARVGRRPPAPRRRCSARRRPGRAARRPPVAAPRRAGRSGRAAGRTGAGGSAAAPRSSHSQDPGGPPPHGHGLDAATSRKRAGSTAWVAARATRMTPSSSGSRSPSSTVGANSAISSRNRTPPWARLISPGRSEDEPPPTRATTELVWCGARNGGTRTKPPRGIGIPAAEWIIVACTASSRSSGGSSPGRRWASIVLPEPGEPTISRWWPPAAAISSARRATGWPRTSARSGGTGSSTPADGPGSSGHSARPRSAATTSARVDADAHAAGGRHVGLGRRRARHDDDAVGQHGDHRSHAGDPPHRAVEPQLADEREVVRRTWRELLVGEEDPDGHGEVEPGPDLARGRRRQVDGDALGRPGEPGAHDGGAAPGREPPGRPHRACRRCGSRAARGPTWTSTRTAKPLAPRRLADEMDASTVPSHADDGSGEER